MVKISKESLESFQSALETVDTSWQTEFNLRETVRQSFDLIKKAKEYKVSWEKIAEILKQSSGTTEGISPESIRQYYFEFSKHPELLPKKKRKSTGSKNNQKSESKADTVETSVTTMTVETPGSSENVAINTTEAVSDESNNFSEVEIEPQPQTELIPPEKTEPRTKRKFGALYETGNKKASDEFNL